jgi:hypothetical protein
MAREQLETCQTVSDTGSRKSGEAFDLSPDLVAITGHQTIPGISDKSEGVQVWIKMLACRVRFRGARKLDLVRVSAGLVQVKPQRSCECCFQARRSDFRNVDVHSVIRFEKDAKFLSYRSSHN